MTAVGVDVGKAVLDLAVQRVVRRHGKSML